MRHTYGFRIFHFHIFVFHWYTDEKETIGCGNPVHAGAEAPAHAEDIVIS
jgi:hypothetical protein